MDKDTRNAIERATQRARKLLEEDFAAQLEGDFDVQLSGAVATKAGDHLSARQAFQRERIVAALEHKRAAGMNSVDSVADYLRDTSFTTLNRFVALKMLEARELVLECVTKGEQSAGYREFCGMAPALAILPNSAGYRLYIESLFDELSTEVKVLFDRRDPSSVLWPKRVTFEQLLDVLNAAELSRVWGEDETIGWVYQFFNGQDERRKMREESQAPRNSRELAVRNQFFTPRYVVQFLTDNTLGRMWYEMRGSKTALADRCEYMVRMPGEVLAPRPKKDPRELRLLDPACGSGHFLLYAFDLLLTIYEEGYADPASPKSEATGKTLAEEYASIDALRRSLPGLVLANNLHGVDIDARCAQIAQLALWMRAQKAYHDFGFRRAERAQIRRSNVVVAEPLVADDHIVKEFITSLGDSELERVFRSLAESLKLAGDLGLLLRIEELVARQSKHGQPSNLFAPTEDRIRTALERLDREAAGASTRRRLFADDTAHGVALLGVAEKKFDVILTNPPFGEGSLRAKAAFEAAYPHSRSELYAAFVDRAIELLVAGGRIGAITSRTGFFLPSLEDWRRHVLASAPPVVCADLGYGVLDAALVEVAAYCLEKDPARTLGIFLKVVDADDKASAIRASMPASSGAQHPQLFSVPLRDFDAIPGSPFAYSASQELRDCYRRHPPLESNGRTAKQGLVTGDDIRLVRTWWEVPPDSIGTTWQPFAKGGATAAYYADLALVVRYDNVGQLAILYGGRYGRGADCYYLPGLTWPHRSARLSVAALPAGALFSQSGKAAFAAPSELPVLLALLNASIATQLARLQSDSVRLKFEVGLVQRLPIPGEISDEIRHALGTFSSRAWRIKHVLDSNNENSHAFLLPTRLANMVNAAPADRERYEHELVEIQERIDETVSALYGSDLRAEMPSVATDASTDPEESDAEDREEAVVSEEVGLRSWLVGTTFGRFDPRLATSERRIPSELGPFEPLPSRSPGMCPKGKEPDDQPDVLVDDLGHADDLTARAHAIAERISVEVPAGLRAWLAKEFFALHIKMYSKSRRKAPIYWQLATPAASYSVWLYIHAFSKDTLFRVQNDYVAPKLAQEERRLDSHASELREGASATQRKALAAQETFVEELRAFFDEVKRVAPLWNPDLDDGIIINFAPLWRLVPQEKSWQKELKSTWDALCEGEYDWAHLAMHLWPERVVPKCAKDRSLAIAHGLEDVFWIEGTDGKWTVRKAPTKSADDIVKERTSPAVKAALKSLLEAPVASGKTSYGRKGGGQRKPASKGGNG